MRSAICLGLMALLASGAARGQDSERLGLEDRIRDPRRVEQRQPAEPEPPPVAAPATPRGAVEHSVEIAAPVEAVWAYLGDDAHARGWSVYFHHITPLPGVPQGQQGALRRCFRQADEGGRRWDEELVAVVPLRLRHIKQFAMVGYGWGAHSGVHDVWQVYEPLGPDRTRLTFRTAPRAGSPAWQWVLYLGSRRRIKEIFRQNLENIRAAVEQGPAYQRLWPYESQGR